MNQKKLQHAEALFLQKYPEGFSNPEMQALGKKHKVEKMVSLSQESFAKANFKDNHEVAESMIKVVSRSSMVSMFEKPKFRDYVRSLDTNELKPLVNGLKGFLHGDQQKGFEAMVASLKPAKLAKWSLITIIPNYYFPDDEVFVKPTTAKNVLKYFEIDDPVYKPTPSWDFYKKYRKLINDSKGLVDSSLSPSNAAFSGFLMMTVKK